MTDSPVVVWLRNDLRLDDNPALAHAAETGRPVVVLYVLDEESEGLRPLGGAHHWWLHHSLKALGASLERLGSKLILRRGKGAEIVPEIVRGTKAGALYLNRRYDRAGRDVDEAVRDALEDVEVEVFTANILHEPEKVKTGSGGWYKVYTPFRRKLEEAGDPRDPIDAPDAIAAPGRLPRSESLDGWGLLPTKPDWSGGIADAWKPGEAAGLKRFAMFCDELLKGYEAGRENPSGDETSRMSPYLKFGEVSPYRLWHEAVGAAARRRSIPSGAIGLFKSELIWRDFNTHLLFHFEDLGTRDFNPRFERFEWRKDEGELEAWRRGRTGYPIVDAGMRQLWQTGWMHNRVRMIVGSFLTRDLLIDWREGERWFWDTLVDGDAASNTSQWQWIAGTGADAQPFFRIFNPLTQSRKFDSGGDYIRRFVPELAKLPDKVIHAPWEASDTVLKKAGVTLGETYPRPVVDHDEARRRALEAYETVKG